MNAISWSCGGRIIFEIGVATVCAMYNHVCFFMKYAFSYNMEHYYFTTISSCYLLKQKVGSFEMSIIISIKDFHSSPL